MNQLFNSQNVKWNGTNYEEVLDDDLDANDEENNTDENVTSSDDEDNLVEG